MLNFKSKTLSEQELMTQLKKVIENCDREDFKTKKFVGLLYDYIPYNNGLKTRLELIGKTGYIDEVMKLGKDADSNTKKLERFSVQIASEYGFRPEIMIKTFTLLAKTLNLPVNSEQSEIARDGSQIITNTIRGNFSKNHRKEAVMQEVVRMNPVDSPTVVENKKVRSSGQTRAVNPKRRWLRNKGNLFKILFFLFALTAGELYLNYYFENIPVAFQALESVVVSWWPMLIVASVLISLVAQLSYRKLKVNLCNFFPIIMLILQLVGIVFKVEAPALYESAQLAILMTLAGSFILTTGYAVRLPKGATDFISHKAIYSYYATGILYFLGQYLVRISV
ncbi:hypothetical protein [Fusibacter ferrireducens]|uniref:Uncharacterized protein n=1 Tax=Fusibacter ferrireducens TaxID=2785058 RepID=A0ABR9ZVU3_9FIRM|nr:hypothetical protein [Fusibacter ferrireducens]MBF4694111.1 hypothetical protein [Fusibacter ferrireducens]